MTGAIALHDLYSGAPHASGALEVLAARAVAVGAADRVEGLREAWRLAGAEAAAEAACTGLRTGPRVAEATVRGAGGVAEATVPGGGGAAVATVRGAGGAAEATVPAGAWAALLAVWARDVAGEYPDLAIEARWVVAIFDPRV